MFYVLLTRLRSCFLHTACPFSEMEIGRRCGHTKPQDQRLSSDFAGHPTPRRPASASSLVVGGRSHAIEFKFSLCHLSSRLYGASFNVDENEQNSARNRGAWDDSWIVFQLCQLWKTRLGNCVVIGSRLHAPLYSSPRGAPGSGSRWRVNTREWRQQL